MQSAGHVWVLWDVSGCHNVEMDFHRDLEF